MTKNDKIYRIVSIGIFLLHICVFVFVVLIGFLPFKENENFYEVFNGFFGERFAAIQPYFILAILLVSSILSYFTIKHPWLSLGVLICSFYSFLIVVIPIAVEIALVSFTSPWLGTSMSTYGIGFSLMNAASCIVNVDIVFLIYAMVTLVVRAKRKYKETKFPVNDEPKTSF